MSMSESTPAVVDESPALRCARHPKVETYLRCGRCETPICTKCQVQTPVGIRCRTCAQVKRFAPEARPREFARAAGMGIAVAAVGMVIVNLIPFLNLLGTVFVGYAVGEAVSVGANRRRGVQLAALAVACLVVGYLLAPFLSSLLAGRPLPLSVLPALVLGSIFRPLTLLGILVGGLIAWMRVR